jgi:hypothetical protein
LEDFALSLLLGEGFDARGGRRARTHVERKLCADKCGEER